jgi:hypothetical protein
MTTTTSGDHGSRGSAAVPRSAAAPALVKLLIAAAAMCPHPVTDRLARDAQQTSDLDLLVPLIDQSHSPPAKFFLSVLRQQASRARCRRRCRCRGSSGHRAAYVDHSNALGHYARRRGDRTYFV